MTTKLTRLPPLVQITTIAEFAHISLISLTLSQICFSGFLISTGYLSSEPFITPELLAVQFLSRSHQLSTQSYKLKSPLHKTLHVRFLVLDYWSPTKPFIIPAVALRSSQVVYATLIDLPHGPVRFIFHYQICTLLLDSYSLLQLLLLTLLWMHIGGHIGSCHTSE